VIEILSASRPIAVGGESDVEPSTEYEASRQPEEAVEALDAGFPTCPSCSAPLTEWLRKRTIDAEGPGGVSSTTIAYCGRCGAAIGTVP
jgi:hypothetical protein